MQLFRTILTALALGSALFSANSTLAIAQNADSARSDEAIVDFAQAYKQRDRKRMAALLGPVRGSSLEPWAVYWELSSRLDTASKTEIQTALGRIEGTYQEDRLRAEWLMQLGRNRDWATFDQEYKLYRMGDERALQCYALWSDYANNGADVAKTVQDLWLSLREGDEACAGIAELLIEHKKLPAQTAWVRARLGMENDRLRIATQAVAMLDSGWVKTVNSIYLNPGKYLSDKLTALRPATREMVSLAIIRQAYLDPTEAAMEVEKLRWRAQLTAEERSWIWGVIGKQAARKHANNASELFSKGQFNLMHEDHIAWAARAATRCSSNCP